MSTERHIIDPDGDVILILTLPNTAPPTGPESDTAGKVQDVKSDAAQKDEETDGEPEKDKTEAPKDSASTNLSSETPQLAPLSEVEMVVSSKHLSLASEVFKKMLGGNFREGVTLIAVKKVEIRLPDDDVDIMLLLMKIIHSRWRSISRGMDFATVRKVALLVDKYVVQESAIPAFYLWLDLLKDQEPKTLDSTIAPWLFIYWTSKLPVGFRRLTQLVERQSRGRLVKEEELPLPNSVLDAIEENRKKALHFMFAELRKCLDEYETAATPRCKLGNRQCDFMVLGALRVGLASKKLLPLPKSPYGGSFDQLAAMVRKLPHATPELLQMHYRTDCGLKAKIDTLVNQAAANLTGLELADFEGKLPNRDRT